MVDSGTCSAPPYLAMSAIAITAYRPLVLSSMNKPPPASTREASSPLATPTRTCAKRPARAGSLKTFYHLFRTVLNLYPEYENSEPGNQAFSRHEVVNARRAGGRSVSPNARPERTHARADHQWARRPA